MRICLSLSFLVSFASTKKPFLSITVSSVKFLEYVFVGSILLAQSIPTRRLLSMESSEEAGLDANVSFAATHGTTVGTTH